MGSEPKSGAGHSRSFGVFNCFGGGTDRSTEAKNAGLSRMTGDCHAVLRSGRCPCLVVKPLGAGSEVVAVGRGFGF